MYIQHYSSREEWLKGRELGIGSSEVGTILGINHFDTPLRLWRRKQKIDPPTQENDAMRRGHRIEGVVANDFAEATGAIIDDNSVNDWHAIDETREYLRVSPDRLFWVKGTSESDRTLENALILECKSCQHRITPETVFEVYPYWYAQVQYQMGVMGIKKCALAWIIVSDSNLPFGYTWVDFNPAYYHYNMVPKLEKFWTENILEGVEPEDIIDDEDVKLKFGAATTGSQVLAQPEAIANVERYCEISSQIKTLQKEADTLKVEIKKAIGENESLVLSSGVEIASWKNIGDGRFFSEEALKQDDYGTWEKYCRLFDESAYKESNPEEYKKYMLAGSASRRLVVKGMSAARRSASRKSMASAASV